MKEELDRHERYHEYRKLAQEVDNTMAVVEFSFKEIELAQLQVRHQLDQLRQYREQLEEKDERRRDAVECLQRFAEGLGIS